MRNKQAITLLFIANIISGFAQGISMIAIPWYFADILKLPSTYAIAYAILNIVWSTLCYNHREELLPIQLHSLNILL